MKKFICLGLMLVLTLNLATTAFAGATASNESEQNVLYLNHSEVTDTLDLELMEDYLQSGGIIVVKNDDKFVESNENELNPYANPNAEDTTSVEDEVAFDPGVDVATLYYEYGDGLSGIYNINVGTDDIGATDSIISGVIEEIRTRQEMQYSITEPMVVNDESYYATHLNTLDTITVRQPKGYINAQYKVYCLEDYLSEDFYIIKAKFDGTPGCVLAEDDDAYDSQYQGEWLYTYMSTNTTSVAVDDYGPTSTVGSTSYSVDISGSIDTDKVFGVSGGFSWSRTIEDVNIDANRLTQKAEWDCDLSYGAHKTTFTFEPGATFDCPTGKTQVKIKVYAEYTLDALLATAEKIKIDETIVCTPSSAYFE